MDELSPRARRTALEVLDLFGTLLRPELAVLLDRLQVDLAASPATAGARASRDCCIESLKILRSRRNEFFPAFVHALHRGWAEGLGAVRSPGMATINAASMPLQLLDNDAMDEDGTLAAIASRHEHRASLPLLLLGQRFGVLLASPPLSAAQLPVGPQALGHALATAGRRVGLCIEARMALYRLHDMVLMSGFPGFAEAMDAHVDRAGVLPGLAFVPLRPISGTNHVSRGQAAADSTPQSRTEADATKAVNDALDALRQAGSLPESMRADRNLAISAMAKYLLRHGQDSSEWQACLRHARTVIEATQTRQPPSAETRTWIEEALHSVGYSSDEARAHALSLTSVSSLKDPVVRSASEVRSAREQRCVERLAALSLGVKIGFSTGTGGFTRSRLRYHYVEPGLLLLANELDGQEALFEIDAIARQMAAGQAWIIRHASSSSQDGEDADADRPRDAKAVREWSQPARGSRPA